MSAISGTYNRGHNILEFVDILPNASFTKSETEIIIINKCDKYELTDDLLNNVKLKKISNSMEL